jgi:hypothetical protein
LCAVVSFGDTVIDFRPIRTGDPSFRGLFVIMFRVANRLCCHRKIVLEELRARIVAANRHAPDPVSFLFVIICSVVQFSVKLQKKSKLCYVGSSRDTKLWLLRRRWREAVRSKRR